MRMLLGPPRATLLGPRSGDGVTLGMIPPLRACISSAMALDDASESYSTSSSSQTKSSSAEHASSSDSAPESPPSASLASSSIHANAFFFADSMTALRWGLRRPPPGVIAVDVPDASEGSGSEAGGAAYLEDFLSADLGNALGCVDARGARAPAAAERSEGCPASAASSKLGAAMIAASRSSRSARIFLLDAILRRMDFFPVVGGARLKAGRAGGVVAAGGVPTAGDSPDPSSSEAFTSTPSLASSSLSLSTMVRDLRPGVRLALIGASSSSDL